MIRTLLIEDRVNRQKKYLAERLSELNKLSNLKNISGGDEFEEIYFRFQKSDFSVLDEFSTILIHRSAFSVNTRNELIDYLRQKEKKVVFFSGGISSCEVTKIGKTELLLINVDQFYSENLFYFLENGANNLLELAFGKNWQLSTLVDTYEKLSLYLKSYQDRPLIKIENDLKLNIWIKGEYFNNQLNNSIISKSVIEDILIKISADLKKIL
jgi:hypothetical protein